MMVWKLILDPKVLTMTIHEVASVAEKLGYPMFVYDNRIYRVDKHSEGSPPHFTETESTADMFQQPDIFCVMDAKLQKIAMNDLGPVLFANPMAAQLFAEHVGGVSKLFGEAIYLQRKAQETPASDLVVPDSAGRIIPARR